MQRLTTVAWSLDNKYVLSGSDEMCIRLWKARASERIGIMRDRERVALQYNEKLKEKYGQHPQIARWILSALRHSSLLILFLQDRETQTSPPACQVQSGRDQIYQGRQSGRLCNCLTLFVFLRSPTRGKKPTDGNTASRGLCRTCLSERLTPYRRWSDGAFLIIFSYFCQKCHGNIHADK